MNIKNTLKDPHAIAGSPAQGMFAATLAFFIGLAAVALFGPTAKKLNSVLKLDPTTLAFLIAIPSLLGALLRIPFGAWVDKVGGRLPNLILLTLSLAGVTGLALVLSLSPVPDFTLLMIFGAIAGCGITTFSVCTGMTSYWYPKAKQGTALGIFAGVGNLSPGIASLLIPISLLAFGMGATYWLWVGFLGLGLALFVFTGRDAWYFQYRQAGMSPEEARDKAGERGQELFPTGTVVQSLKISASYWQTWVLVAIYFTSFGGFLALTAYFPTYWQNYYKLDLFTASAILTAGFSIGTSLIRVATGFITDKLGGEKTAAIALSLTAVGSLLMVISPSLAVSVAGTALIAVGMGANNAATFRILPNVIPKAMGGASGWVGGLASTGATIFPVLMSLFIDAGRAADPAYVDPGYNQGFMVFLAASLISLALLIFLFRAKARPVESK